MQIPFVLSCLATRHRALMKVCLNLFRPGWNGWNWTRLLVVVRSIPSSFCPFWISRQASNRPEQNMTRLTFAVGPRSSTRRQGVVTWAASALDTENYFACKYSARRASEQAVLAIQVAPSGEVLKSLYRHRGSTTPDISMESVPQMFQKYIAKASLAVPSFFI